MNRAYDFFGNVVLIKFPKKMSIKDKKMFALKLMSKQNSIKTVLEKSGKFKGRLRKMETKYLAGVKNKEVLYKENGCVFRFNIDSTYFSPRLSNERKEIALNIKENDKVLVMFAGVAPYSIVIAKNSKASKVVSVELNREANKYAKINVELNKLKYIVNVVQGDVKNYALKAKSRKERFDVIVMPRPQLKDSFLDSAFLLSKKNTIIYYYDFCNIKDTDKIINKIQDEAKKAGKNIKILNVKTAGEIAPKKIRIRVDFVVL